MEWFVLAPGAEAPLGPLSTELIVRGIQAGRVPPDAMVCEVGSSEWRSLGSTAAFAVAAPAQPQAAPAPQVRASGTFKEQTFINEHGVWVTSHRVHIGSTMAVVAHVTNTHRWTARMSLVPLIVGIFLLLIGLVFGSVDNGLRNLGFFVALVGMIAATIWFLSKPKYWLRITTSASESQLFMSEDAALVGRIHDAVQQAILLR